MAHAGTAKRDDVRDIRSKNIRKDSELRAGKETLASDRSRTFARSDLKPLGSRL